jgi:hypothetical protein
LFKPATLVKKICRHSIEEEKYFNAFGIQKVMAGMNIYSFLKKVAITS